MAFENAEVKVISSEKVLDTDPELYKKRALDALEKHYYLDAMAEAEKAIEYGYNWPRFRVVKARVLLATEKYAECLRYLKESELWQLKDDMSELSYEDKDFVRYAFSVCLGQLGFKPDKLREIILTSDGRGMCKSVQEAIDNYSDKKIILTGGTYSENISVTNKKIEIVGLRYQKAVIHGKWSINGGKVSISNIEFGYENRKEHKLLEIINSDFKLRDITFKGIGRNKNSIEQDQPGLTLINSRSEDRIDGLIFENLDLGMLIKNTSVSVANCKFSTLSSGLFLVNTNANYDVEVRNCSFSNNEVGIISGPSGWADILSSKFYMCNIAASTLDSDETGEIVYDRNAGIIRIRDNSEIVGSSRAAIVALKSGQVHLENSILKNNAQIFISDGEGKCYMNNIKEVGNNAMGNIGENVKNIFKLLFS